MSTATLLVILLTTLTAATAAFVMIDSRRSRARLRAGSTEPPADEEPASAPDFPGFHVTENYRLKDITISVLSSADRGAASCAELYPASRTHPNGDVKGWLNDNRSTGAWLQGKKREKIPPREFVQLLRRFPGSATLVDVADPATFAKGHLPGAVNIPLGELPNRFSEIPRTKPVVFYCRIGQRSPRACYRAQEKGGIPREDSYFLDACVRFPGDGTAELIEAFE